jgi:hypothetical protein
MNPSNEIQKLDYGDLVSLSAVSEFCPDGTIGSVCGISAFGLGSNKNTLYLVEIQDGRAIETTECHLKKVNGN